MKYFCLVIVSSIFFSCTENDNKKDVETNTYYSKYNFIYQNQDSLGFETSIALLDEYIEEFPNAKNAFLFKAFLLAKNNDLDKVKPIFEQIKLIDSTDAKVYTQWSAMLLLDSSKIAEAIHKNSQALSIDSTLIEAKHNNTWIALYQNEKESALRNAIKVKKLDTTNTIKYQYALLIASLAAQNDSIYQFYEKQKHTIDFALIDSFREQKISLEAVYNRLSK